MHQKHLCIHRFNSAYMSSKNISLREDVYRALSEEKGEDESFSDTINRLISARRGEHPLYDIVGILDEDEANRVRERTAAFRVQLDRDMERDA